MPSILSHAVAANGHRSLLLRLCGPKKTTARPGEPETGGCMLFYEMP